ncbi:MAG: hypothetical protein CM15mV21_0850 [Eurybiavirus sp.]|nr:MAG: hypothetical protein CM15mV21_0850 [Eurybiavirus sp.]
MKKSELIHWRLQAMLREHTFSDLAYLGIRDNQHWYSIDGNEVPVDAIEELESVETE